MTHGTQSSQPTQIFIPDLGTYLYLRRNFKDPERERGQITDFVESAAREMRAAKNLEEEVALAKFAGLRLSRYLQPRLEETTQASNLASMALECVEAVRIAVFNFITGDSVGPLDVVLQGYPGNCAPELIAFKNPRYECTGPRWMREAASLPMIPLSKADFSKWRNTATKAVRDYIREVVEQETGLRPTLMEPHPFLKKFARVHLKDRPLGGVIDDLTDEVRGGFRGMQTIHPEAIPFSVNLPSGFPVASRFPGGLPV